ncbi:hypothetical protein SeMB42_g04533 [Synchytrium endobioticum]|uniref:Vacuolar calcium ion transporter n=1 Tax=Synchytrium endobioticum TaxID=286115 RepID=A0A507CXE4_9FUNG|nr:hypothetical protein SeMB42_g04533 [Synchytrium endobioticum]
MMSRNPVTAPRRTLISRKSFTQGYRNLGAAESSRPTASEQQPLLAPPDTLTLLPSSNRHPGPVPEKPTWKSSAKATFFASKMNILLAFVPLGIISGELNWREYATFFLNSLAIIPLAGLLGFATEEVGLRCGERIGGLVNGTFGNATELIVGIFALKQGLISVVQASLLGSMLSNLLLVTGLCFFVGGMSFKIQKFNPTAAQTSASLMALTVFAYLIPAAFLFQSPSDEDSDTTLTHVKNLSRATSIVLLLIYVCFLVFSLWTHTVLFDTAEPSPDDENENPQLTLNFALVLLLVVTIIITVCADYLVGSIDGLTSKLGWTQAFVGIILLPIVGNAAEHYTAVIMATRNKMDLAVSVAVGSTMQIALLVTPSLVLLGWCLDQPLTLAFPPFMSVTIFVAVFVVNSLIRDGESNWIEGAMLLGGYCILAVAFFYVSARVSCNDEGMMFSWIHANCLYV